MFGGGRLFAAGRRVLSRGFSSSYASQRVGGTRFGIKAAGVLAGSAGVAVLATRGTHVAQNSGNILDEINQRLMRIEKMLLSYREFLDTIRELKKTHPGNLMAKHFDFEYFNSLAPELQERLVKICQSGVDNADSGMGCYAMQPEDYDLFKDFLGKVIQDYHKINGEVQHVTNWDLKSVQDKLPPGGVLDLTKLGLGTTSMRVRVGRNLAAYPLPGAMSKDDRVNLEKDMVSAFKKLMRDPSYGGTYYSLTPGTEYTISDAKYKDLVKRHIMFKDMAADPYLNSAGISNDWPYGRGCYVSADGQFIVWVGEEDHLRIMCMKKGTVLNDVFDRLSDACKVVEENAGKFAHSEQYGYVTSCPTNLGTGMRASVHIKVPGLTTDGTEKKAKEVCKPLGLSVRGAGGEHTPIGADGTVDISPSARLCIQEAEIIAALYEGIQLLLKEEAKAKRNSKL
uniref:Arginine kinase n=1 Tax=Mucochytrium quahogii TaxID=96639 RepID=A0A7S2W6J3_9STRA|mmetsp:Transcript_650/g.1103  ORF Transcript_650/g.1103 Transcript_650/m.1103 type:complete len:453 (-) Transcript_650:35-1393(-)|eukprot:CAMPEP_0203748172 /NCGR_PEP_ID=MMETSP0098-20131031/3118_1 /ASSEMBLY_ACC=CAM_ASM_000208 /TAXON_ID=96639 /ORGANISM=" , Strain NY0313808BC1" /LENGTH=452 /DNA_ID=CAMNT_0050636817 /DNA_START=228 /DNA_END=1586 /DNA_ORIENTATION=-